MTSPEQVVVIVMGSTGTGKSSFIKLLTGNSAVKIGASLDSETSCVQVINSVDPVSHRKVTIADTPGFDDSRTGFTDTQILATITQFLLDEYDGDRKLTALVYFQRISDPRFGGQAARNLKIFQRLCGPRNYKNVVILTTFWDRVDVEEEGLKREEQLKSRYLKDLVDGGAHFMRFNQTPESAQRILRHILSLTPTSIEIQREIRLEGKSLEETAAGSVHREEVERVIAQHKKELAELKAELLEAKAADKSLRRELEKERADLLEKLARWEKEKISLKKGLAEALEIQKASQAEALWSAENHLKVHQELENMRLKRIERETDVPPPYEEVESFKGLSPLRNASFEFMQSSTYPPYLKSIPKSHQSRPEEIFHYTSLIQTAIMIKFDADAWPNFRKRAPDVSRIRSIQDLVDHNRRLHLDSRNQHNVDMYYSANIGLRDDWYSDAIFAQQQFTGTNPTTITLASARWVKEFKSTAHAQRRDDIEKLLSDDLSSLFIQDYSDYRSIMDVSSVAELSEDGRYGCSSVVLFHLEPKGKLHPLAITLDYKGSMEKSVTIFNRRVAASSPGNESTDWPWRYAKMCAQSSDWLRHEVTIHLVNTHLVEEVLIVAAHRALDPFHIVFKLLQPHWTTTLSLNKAARETLVPKVIIPLAGFSPSQISSFLKNQFRSFDWTGSYVPNDLRRRGFPIEDLDKPKFHNYAYARNIYRLWQIIRKFVSSVLTEVYVGGDSQVASDICIAAFCQEVRSNHGGQLSSFPIIRTLKDLIDCVTMCIHIASPQHTAVNYLQQYYQTFVPNKPSALYRPLPQSLTALRTFTEADVLSALPIHRPKDWLIMAQLPYLLSFEVPNDSTILYYAQTTPNERSTPQVIRNAAKALESDLNAFVYVTSKYSMELDDQQTPYHVLDPARTAISILS